MDGLLRGVQGAGELVVTLDATDAHVLGIGLWAHTSGLDVKLDCTAGTKGSACL